MVGICSQWAKRNEELTLYEKIVYWGIADKSFGFAKRYCYLKLDGFEISKTTASTAIKGLVEKGIISYKNTFKDNGHRGMNEYRILEPSDNIKKFIFVGSHEEPKKESEKETETEEEINPWLE